jgi:hypothetical protein
MSEQVNNYVCNTVPVKKTTAADIFVFHNEAIFTMHIGITSVLLRCLVTE